MNSFPRRRVFHVPYLQIPWLFLLYVAAILAITWPWVMHFSTAVLAHWDPPFHAWKLEWVARSILSGHLLPPGGCTNVYYPQPGTLYYEALHWPQALFAAPLFALPGANSVLIYHITLVVFWALSGVTCWMCLLAWGTTRRGAILGSLIFVLMPYRTSYMMEFNMQLCFALPLFFFFLIRYFQFPSIRYACGMAVAWWLQATSELYQAIFLLFIVPFPFLAAWAGDWSLLKSWRKFWLPFLCAGLLGAALCLPFLLGYLQALSTQAVSRGLEEIRTHLLEPISYLRVGGRFALLSVLDTKRGEMLVYPTMFVILFTIIYFFMDAKRLAHIRVPKWIWVLRGVRWVAIAGFGFTTLLFYFVGVFRGFYGVYGWLPLIAILASIPILFHPTHHRSRQLLLTGFFTGALFAYFMSLGPEVTLRHIQVHAPNQLYLFLYHTMKALHGFRVVSRFSVFILLFMITAASLAWSRLERRYLQSPTWRWLWVIPLAWVILESIPDPFRLSDLSSRIQSPILSVADAMKPSPVLAIIPMGDRYHDSRYMLQIGGAERFLTYAWGGAFPQFQREICHSLNSAHLNPEIARQLLSQTWPESLILVDKHFAQNIRYPCDFPRALSDVSSVLAEDDDYALLQLKPDPVPHTEYTRLVRPDVLRQNPCLEFQLRSANPDMTPSRIRLLLDGKPIGDFLADVSSPPEQLTLQHPLAAKLEPCRLQFQSVDEAPFHLDLFRLSPAPSE